MKFENVRVYNFEGALRGMRNPKNSWHLSDSNFGICAYNDARKIFNIFLKQWLDGQYIDTFTYEEFYDKVINDIIVWTDKANFCEYVSIGPKDMKLATTLIHSGPEHRKFLRQIFVSVDITAPLYWY